MRLYRYHHAGLRGALLASAMIAAAWGTPALAQDATWTGPGNQWTDSANWTPGAVPAATATFAGANPTSVIVSNSATIGAIQFTSPTPYTFSITGGLFILNGDGIISGIANAPNFVNSAGLRFAGASTAGNSVITTSNGGVTSFIGTSTGGNAQFNTDAGGVVDFSRSAGPAGNQQLSAGSIAGAGDYYLGSNIVTVGGNNLSTTVSGVISDCGPGGSDCLDAGATNGSLVKTGTGTLTLSGANLYTGGTTISAGTLAVANDNALGTGQVTLMGGTLSGAASPGGTVNVFNNIAVNGASGITAVTGTTLSLQGTFSFGAPSSVTTFGSLTDLGTVSFAGSPGSFDTTAKFVVAGGTLSDSAGTLASLLGSLASTTVNSGATLDLTNSVFASIRNLKGAGSVVIGPDPVPGFAMLGVGADPGQSSEFSGTISGPGSIQIYTTIYGPANTPGRVILSGNNTYGGDTYICECAELQVGNGGTTGTISGNVFNAGTLIFNRSNTYTFNGVISDDPSLPGFSGSLVQAGTGTTVLNAVNTYTGTTTVNAGTLSVNGSIAASSGVTVNAGGTLAGIGTVAPTVINGGTLSPGNSIGTITVANSLSFVGPGNYIVEVGPGAGNNDRTNVTGAPGTATLAGTLTAVGTGGSYVVGTRYTVLNATGTVSGTFSNSAIAGNFGMTTPHIEYDGNNVYLVLDQRTLSPTGGTSNQNAIVSVINSAVIAGNTSGPILALFGLTAGQLPAALSALSGEVHASTAGALVDESLYVRSAILGRLRQSSYAGDTGMASLAMGGPQAFAGNEELSSALAYAKSPIVTKAPMIAPAPSSDITFWSQGFGAWGKFNSDGNAAGVKRDLAGVITGFDARFGAWRGGLAAGYTGSRNITDGRGTATVETGHIAAYGGWNFGALNLRGGGAYAFHTIDTDRTIAFPGFFDRATAHYQGGTGQIFGEAGYGFAFGKLAIEPFAGAAFVHLDTDAFSERGGAAVLNVAASSFETGYSTLGVRAASMIPLADMILVPRASAAWQHAFNSTTPQAAVAFQAVAGSFVVAGVPIARDSLLAEAGLDLAIGRNTTVGVSYVGQIARNVTDHAAKGKFAWKF